MGNDTIVEMDTIVESIEGIIAAGEVDMVMRPTLIWSRKTLYWSVVERQ